MNWINHTEVDDSISFDSAYPVDSDFCGRIDIDHISIPVYLIFYSVGILESLNLQWSQAGICLFNMKPCEKRYQTSKLNVSRFVLCSACKPRFVAIKST